MKQETRVRRSLMLTLAAILLLVGGLVQAQTPDTQNPGAAQQGQIQANQAQLPDLAQLNLTQDQIQKIRMINADLRDQRQAANQHLRLTQRALGDAIEASNPNEALIEQRSHEVADAQAATIRLRALSESRILQVLTPDQRVKLREMRMRQQAARREQRIENNNQRPRAGRRGNALQRGKLGPKAGPGPNNSNQQRPQP